MANILVVGDIYYENQFFVPLIPVENEFSVASEVLSLTGSKTIYSSRVMTKLKNNVDFFGKAGTDDYYLKVLSDFKKYGINIHSISQSEDTKTGQIVLTTDEKGRSSVSIYFGANSKVTTLEIEELGNSLKKYNMVYAATHLPLTVLYKLIEVCKSKNVPLFLDFPNQQKTVNLKKLQDVDFISPNRQGAEMIFSEKIRTVEDAFRILYLFRKFCKGTIIITLDIDGCAVLERGATDPIYLKTTPVQSTDSTGAGDIFKAVFVSEYLKTKNLELSLRHAQEVATKSVSYRGMDYTLENLDYNFSS